MVKELEDAPAAPKAVNVIVPTIQYPTHRSCAFIVAAKTAGSAGLQPLPPLIPTTTLCFTPAVVDDGPAATGPASC